MHICEDMVGESVGDPPIPARGEGQVEVKPAQDKVQPAQDKKREAIPAAVQLCLYMITVLII